MKRLLHTILVALIFISGHSFAQQLQGQLDSLCILCNQSTSDSQKVVALGNLAEHYYIYKLNSKGDSVLHEQLLIAELSDNSNLILHALFGEAILNISPSSSRKSFDRTIAFIQKGIDYARSAGKYDYLVLGYVRMSEVLRKRGEFQKSFSNCTSALTLLQSVKTDSVKAVAYIEMGESYLARGEAVLACTNFNNAFDIAVKKGSLPLQSRVLHCLSEMYKSLGDEQAAQNELSNSRRMNIQKGNRAGLLMDYIDLTRLSDEKYFIEKSIGLADSLNDSKNLLIAKRLKLVYYYVIEKDQSNAFKYFNEEKDLHQSYLNEGRGNYLSAIGNIYFYCNNIDSALRYYLLAEPDLAKDFEENLSMINYEQIGECYRLRTETPLAITYFEKALTIGRKLNDVRSIASYTGMLSSLFEKNGEFEKALGYSRQADTFKDSIRGLSRQNDIALLGVDRENKKHQQFLLEQQLRANISRNIQYFAITLTIIVVFFVMLFVGSYHITLRTVRWMSFLFFISLFEFIVLFIDNQVLSKPFHDQPFKLWMIKIGLIGMLAPLQHFLEHRITQLLASRQLIAARTNFSLKNWWTSIKTKFVSPPVANEESALL